MQVTLGVAIRLPDRPLYKPGQVVEVDENELKLVEKLNAIAIDEPANNVTVTKQAHTVVPEENVPEGVKRPAKTASADKWAEFLTSRGIDPKGLSKREMIAAVS